MRMRGLWQKELCVINMTARWRALRTPDIRDDSEGIQGAVSGDLKGWVLSFWVIESVAEERCG